VCPPSRGVYGMASARRRPRYLPETNHRRCRRRPDATKTQREEFEAFDEYLQEWYAVGSSPGDPAQKEMVTGSASGARREDEVRSGETGTHSRFCLFCNSRA